MSGFDALLNRLREAQANVAEMQMAARATPNDTYVLANLQSVQRFVRNIESEWEQSCLVNQIEVCRYRLVRNEANRFSVSSFTRSLLDFQELFTQVADAVENGPKKVAKVAADIRRKATFDFGFTYPGSLGVVLFSESERSLFGGALDKAVDAFMQVIQVQDEFQVRDLARELGDAVVKRAFDWASVNGDANLSIDINWATLNGTKKGAFIDVAQQKRLVEIISKASDTELTNFKVVGALVGIDLKTEKFRFVVRDGADIAGTLAASLPRHSQWAVNTNYVAQIEMESVTNLATLQTKKDYRLKALDIELSA